MFETSRRRPGPLQGGAHAHHTSEGDNERVFVGGLGVLFQVAMGAGGVIVDDIHRHHELRPPRLQVVRLYEREQHRASIEASVCALTAPTAISGAVQERRAHACRNRGCSYFVKLNPNLTCRRIITATSSKRDVRRTSFQL